MQNPCEKSALKKAQDYLSLRAHSEHELQCKLLKHFDPPAVEKALSRARELKWLDPPEELARRLAQELHEKKRGWLFIRRALSKRRLPEVPKDEEREEEKCLWWLTKKFSSSYDSEREGLYEPESPPTAGESGGEGTPSTGQEADFAQSAKSFSHRVKMSRFLAYRGFSAETIKKAIDRFLGQT